LNDWKTKPIFLFRTAANWLSLIRLTSTPSIL